MGEKQTGSVDVLSEIAERLAKQFVSQAQKEPGVKASVVEAYAGKMQQFGYQMTPETVSVLADYLKGYNMCLMGNVGIGKTFFFECINKLRSGSGKYPIVKLSMIETQGWDMTNARDWVDDNRDSDILIDDVGTEPKMKSWGQEAELFPYLLEKRMQLSSMRTHLTSNLGIVDIKGRYGERVADRFLQMFKIVKMKARASRRRQSPWRTSKDGSGVL